MKRVCCFFAFCVLCLGIYAQLGYWYENDFVELKPSSDSVFFIQTDASSSGLLKSKIAKNEFKVCSKVSDNRFIIKASRKNIPQTIYLSSLYKHDSKGKGIFVLPQIIISFDSEQAKDSILMQYRGILTEGRKLINMYEITCNVSSADEVLKLVMTISQSKGVNWCEPNMIANFQSFNSLYDEQFYLKNSSSNGVDINVEPAWNVVKVNPNIKVAVIDMGVDLNHEDLRANIIDGYTVNDSTGKGGCSLGSSSHGTACAGIVGAINNSIGVRGVASGVKIMPVDTKLNNINTTVFDIANAIIWAVDNGADVLSCSWGMDETINGTYTIENAINYAWTNGRNGKGAVVVFASGNKYPSCSNVSFPANCSRAIAVGAVDRYGDVCNYSQRGAALELVAPSSQFMGVNEILTTWNSGRGTYGNYELFGGTSAACPQVAGVVALMLSVDSCLTSSTIRERLHSTAKKLPGMRGLNRTDAYGYGLVDAYAAVLSSIRMTGSNTLCDQDVYTIDGISDNCFVEWSLSDSCASIISGQGTNTIIVGKTDYGVCNLVATIYYGDVFVKRVEKVIRVGAPTNIGELEIRNHTGEGSYWLEGSAGNAVLIPNYHNLPYRRYECKVYRWDDQNHEEILVYQANSTAPYFEYSNAWEGWFVVCVRGVGECENSDWSTVEIETVTEPSEGYPWEEFLDFCYDPEGCCLIIGQKESLKMQSAGKFKKSALEKYVVQIWNDMRMVKMISLNQRETRISLADLPKGIYIAKVIQNGKCFEKKFAIIR